MEQVTRLEIGPASGMCQEPRGPPADASRGLHGKDRGRPCFGVPSTGSAGHPRVDGDPEIRTRTAVSGGSPILFDRIFRSHGLRDRAACVARNLDLHVPAGGDAEDDASSETQDEQLGQQGQQDQQASEKRHST